MGFSTISSKGQITLSVDLRREFGLKPHDRVILEKGEKGIVVRAVPDIWKLQGKFKGKRKLAWSREKELAAKALYERGLKAGTRQ
jgi:bifunctional DNA-binding transcriptional regulator/antitoxin component of YhaV-PrlF toxin-antitoxin module